LLFIVAGTLISVYHYLLTVPILGMHLSSGHAILLLGPLLTGSLFAFAWTKIPKEYIAIASVLAVLMVGFGSISGYSNETQGGFWQAGKQPLMPNYASFAEYVFQNDLQQDIFLSTNELSFAIHGVSGVQLVTGRQSHFFIFGDFQSYWEDAAIILYGNNSDLRDSLIETYTSYDRDLYLYWDYFWIRSEWSIANGQIVGPFDPLRFEDTSERRDLFDSVGIPYFVQERDIFEPSARGNRHAHRMNILYVSPEVYRSEEYPWNVDLDQRLEEVWQYSEGDVVYARLFRVR
jgi:hypothetical protein